MTSALAALMGLIGAIGIPADLRSWGSLFASLGSDTGRWILVGAGLAVLLLVQLGPRAWPRGGTDEEEDQAAADAHSPPPPARPEGEPPVADKVIPNQDAPTPTVTPLPSITSSPPLKPATVLGALKDARQDGALLLRAARDPLGGYATFGREVNDATVRSWEANIKHLLRDDTSRLSLFTYDPLAPVGRFTAELIDGLTGRQRVRRLERRLGQLDKVIDSY